MAHPKISPIWDYFEEDTNDPTNVLSNVPGYKARNVSWVKAGLNKGTLSNTPMLNPYPEKFRLVQF